MHATWVVWGGHIMDLVGVGIFFGSAKLFANLRMKQDEEEED